MYLVHFVLSFVLPQLLHVFLHFFLVPSSCVIISVSAMINMAARTSTLSPLLGGTIEAISAKCSPEPDPADIKKYDMMASSQWGPPPSRSPRCRHNHINLTRCAGSNRPQTQEHPFTCSICDATCNHFACLDRAHLGKALYILPDKSLGWSCR